MKIVWSIFIGAEEVHESTLEIDDNATEKEIDNDSGLGLAYRPTRTIRYKGYVTIDNLWGLDLNLGNRCQWWRCKEGEQLMAVEVIGNIHDNPELLEGDTE